MDRSLQCFSCNTGFSSKEMLTRHLPCCDSSFDLSRVKTEVEDSEKSVQRSTSALSQTGHSVTATDCAIAHVKTEVKSEVPDAPETGGSGVHVSNAIFEESALMGLLNKTVVPQYRGRGGRGRGSRGGRGGHRRGLQGASQKSPVSLPAFKGKMLQSVSLDNQSLSNFRIPGLNPGGSVHTKLMNILPKSDSNGKGNGLSKNDVVNFLKSLEVTNINNTTPPANIVVPSTFTVNNLPSSGSSLTGPNVNTLPFGSIILSNNVLSNTQQDTLFLGGSAPLISPMPGTNTLQTPSLVPGFQAINMSQPLANFPNLNIATNQSTSIGILQNIGQVINPGTQSGGIFTSNMNQTLSSVVSTSQQMSYKVPVLVGNQIILMDMPAQYSTGVSLANTPTTVSLSSFGQSLGMFSSAVTPTVEKQQATACIVSTTLPCNSLSANSIHSQPDVTATSLHLSPHLQSHSGTASAIGAQEACESAKTLKPPPPLVLAGCTVSHQSQDGAKLRSANNDALCCKKTTTSNAEVNAKVKIQATQNVKNKRRETQSNENNSAHVNKKLNCDRNIPDAQINTQYYKLSVINPMEGTLSKKPSPAPVIVNEQSVNNAMLSGMTSVANKISAGVKTNKQNVRSLKMETPDSLERKIFPLGKEEKKQSLVMNNPVISDIVGIQGMTVKELLRSNKSNNAKNTATLNKSQHAGRQLFLLRSKPKGKLPFRKSSFPKLSSQHKELQDQTLQPLPKPAGTSTELPNQTVKDDQGNSSVDDSDQSQSNDDIICKISEVKSIADAHPQLVLLKNEDCHNLDQISNDLNKAQGTVFVGPLTKEQLDSIIQNPSELGKYVSVPSGHVLSSKAIVVPAGCTALTVPVMLQSVAAPKKIAPASTVPSSIPSCYPESQFVKIHPKPKIHPKMHPACLPSSSATTNTTSSTVTSFPQITVPLTSASPSSSSSMPKMRVNSLPTVSGKDFGDKKRIVDEKTSNVKPSACSSETYKDEMQASPQKQEYKLECNTAKDLQNSSLIKLSFNGDLNLLKDALRKTTVEIETLDSKSLTKTVGHPRRDSHDSSEEKMSDVSEDDYKPKCRKRRWHNNEEQNIVLTRNKEKELMESIDKRWVPLEVVGDLAVRGRLLEDGFINSGKSDDRRIRRSDRISAKPRLDYADLERLPFEDLDEDTEESDYELYTAPLSLNLQPAASPLPPQLSPILDQGLGQDVLMDAAPTEEGAAEAGDTDDSSHPVLEAQTSEDINQIDSLPHTDDSIHPVLEAQTSKDIGHINNSPHTDDSIHPVLEAQTSKHISPVDSLPQTDDSIHPVLEAQTSKDISHVDSLPQTDDSIHSVLEAQTSKDISHVDSLPHKDDSIHPVLEAQTSKDTSHVDSLPHTDDSIHPVLEAQMSKYINHIDNLPHTDDSILPVLEAQTSKDASHVDSLPHTDDSIHPVLEVQMSKDIGHIDSLPHTDDSIHPVLEAQTSKDASHVDSLPHTDDSIHPVLEAHMSKYINHIDNLPHTDDSIYPMLEAETSIDISHVDSLPHTDDSIHPVLEAQTSKDISNVDSLPQANSCEECYYSSESESDMFDSCDKSLDDISKKKIMWKRHSEITLFLVKHADRFRSDDDSGEHYCNICCRYKTNGIFHLSQHLKKHLVGVLRCSQCGFEACHEHNLVEHRKTRHAL